MLCYVIYPPPFTLIILLGLEGWTISEQKSSQKSRMFLYT